MLVFFALGNAKVLSFALGDAKVPNANGFALQWNIGFMLKFALPLMPNLKFALPPKPTPDASQWNIGSVGSQMQISCVGHLHFIFCV